MNALKSKTIIFSLLLAALGAVQMTYAQLPIPPQWAGIGLTVIGVLVAVLRVVTSVPLSEK